MSEIRYKPIGIIHSPFKEPHGTPIQPTAARDIEGTVEIFPEYVGGLKDIEGFSHVILIYHFHLSKGWTLEVKPYMDDQLRGVFATRAPARPNPIGMSIVHLNRVEEERLYIRDVDIVDGTPLLDIKPYVSEFDAQEVERTGWLTENVHKLRKAKDDGRFIS
ncbi:MAG TPA: tRNA (N6-threonylcarbamoyladenosine(37)-N6)-methyltransferase TrmO [Dehalococcoidia bacterium]|nr:tRNA (N6-threonylcarbamoyladenosine(37)-N6)-methyltransferase TrmO [Dehalococcoidia bacterium]